MVVMDQSVLRSGAGVHGVFFSNSPRKTKTAGARLPPQDLDLVAGRPGQIQGLGEHDGKADGDADGPHVDENLHQGHKGAVEIEKETGHTEQRHGQPQDIVEDVPGSHRNEGAQDGEPHHHHKGGGGHSLGS